MNLNPDDERGLEVQMRLGRDSRLTASDWTQLPDAPVDKAAWAAYRQALRDFPATWEPSEVCDFPNPPDYVEPAPVEEAQTSTDAG
jgi:hypothetical protein